MNACIAACLPGLGSVGLQTQQAVSCGVQLLVSGFVRHTDKGLSRTPEPSSCCLLWMQDSNLMLPTALLENRVSDMRYAVTVY